MNLASRCREAIAQAASLKKELSVQKKKTAEAVSQTHQLIAQLKKMSPERRKSAATTTVTAVVSSAGSEEKTPSPNAVAVMVPVVTPDVSSIEPSLLPDASSPSPSPPIIAIADEEEGDSEHKEDDAPLLYRPEDIVALFDGEKEESRRRSERTNEEEPEAAAIATPLIAATAVIEPTNGLVVDTAGAGSLPSPKPDAPASSEEDLLLEDEEESSDTVATEIVIPPEKLLPSFPVAASPLMNIMTRKQYSLNDSYDEEYPEEPTPLLTSSKKAASSLLSSIDAFEASFSTSFPDSFSPRDEDEGNPSGLYNPFDTNSPAKTDPPSSLSPPPPQVIDGHVSPQPSNNPLSPKSLAHSPGLEMSPRDTPPRKLNAFKFPNRLDEKSSSLLVKPLPMSLNTVDLMQNGEAAYTLRIGEATAATPRAAHNGTLSSTASVSSSESPDIEVVSPNGQTRITMASMANHITPISPSSSFPSPRSNDSTTGGKSSSYEMVVGSGSAATRFMKARNEGPDDEISHARLRSTQARVSPLPSPPADSNVSRFKKTLTISTNDKSKRSLGGVGPLSSRSNGSTESSTATSDTTSSSVSPLTNPKITTPTADMVGTTSTAHGRFHRAARTFHHVGSAAAKVREIKAQRNRSRSAPRVRTTPPSLTFNAASGGGGGGENHQHHLPDRPTHKLTGYNAARARYERAIQSPKDNVKDFKGKDNVASSSSQQPPPPQQSGFENDLLLDDGRQRRNVNLSNRQRRAADCANGSSPLLSSPKRSSLVNTK
jgi:hypothetical protein